ncbi:MAG: hypothetical protein U0U70_13290 [Chitinophagaceae bacterium]
MKIISTLILATLSLYSAGQKLLPEVVVVSYVYPPDHASLKWKIDEIRRSSSSNLEFPVKKKNGFDLRGRLQGRLCCYCSDPPPKEVSTKSLKVSKTPVLVVKSQ